MTLVLVLWRLLLPPSSKFGQRIEPARPGPNVLVSLFALLLDADRIFQGFLGSDVGGIAVVGVAYIPAVVFIVGVIFTSLPAAIRIFRREAASAANFLVCIVSLKLCEGMKLSGVIIFGMSGFDWDCGAGSEV